MRKRKLANLTIERNRIRTCEIDERCCCTFREGDSMRERHRTNRRIEVLRLKRCAINNGIFPEPAHCLIQTRILRQLLRDERQNSGLRWRSKIGDERFCISFA